MPLQIARIVTVENMTDRGGFRTNWHRHGFMQAGYVNQGIYTVQISEKRTMVIHPNEFFSIAPQQGHIIRAIPNNDVKYIDLRCKIIAGKYRINVVPGSTKSMNFLTQYTFKIGKPYARKLLPKLKQMVDFSESSHEIRVFVLALKLFELGRLIETLPKEIKWKIGTSGPSHQAVGVALDFIQENYKKNITVREIAQAADVSVWHLARLFREELNYGPKDYLIRYRVEVARRLLVSRDHWSIKRIAYQTGFTSPQEFTRTFRRIEGCVPSNFSK